MPNQALDRGRILFSRDTSRLQRPRRVNWCVRLTKANAVKRNLTIFLCSTFADLAEERQAVLDAVRKLQLQHDSMEFFGARPGAPIETCLAEVRKSDILVVIV